MNTSGLVLSFVLGPHKEDIVSSGGRDSHNTHHEPENDPSHERKETGRTRFSGQVLGQPVHKHRDCFSCVCSIKIELGRSYSPGK